VKLYIVPRDKSVKVEIVVFSEVFEAVAVAPGLTLKYFPVENPEIPIEAEPDTTGLLAVLGEYTNSILFVVSYNLH
jgi:hypothetical protein